MTQIIEISTQYQLANISALVRAGRLGEPNERRILVVANNSFAPELTPAADAMPGSTGLLADFDAVVDWNATIWPNHPKAFGISGERAPIMERALRRGGTSPMTRLELIVESLPSHPAGALTQIFSTADISVHSDGLMSYRPIRNPLTLPQWQRTKAIFYTDLLASPHVSWPNTTRTAWCCRLTISPGSSTKWPPRWPMSWRAPTSMPRSKAVRSCSVSTSRSSTSSRPKKSSICTCRCSMWSRPPG